MGVQIPNVKGQFLGVVRPIEKHCTYCCIHHNKISNGKNANAACCPLHCYRLAGVTLTFRLKNPPLRCGLSSKLFDHLFISSPHAHTVDRFPLFSSPLSPFFSFPSLLFCPFPSLPFSYPLIPCPPSLTLSYLFTSLSLEVGPLKYDAIW